MVKTKDGHKIRSYDLCYTPMFNIRTQSLQPGRDRAKSINDNGMDCFKSYDECQIECNNRNTERGYTK